MLKEKFNDNAFGAGIQFKFPQNENERIIKVVGVGGGGCNAVRNMFNEGIQGVTYLALNTDNQQLKASPVPVKLVIGKDGLGAGGDPEKGRLAAEESREQIKNLLNDGTKMVFITASMGGGTGTGAASVVANIAHELGLLTIGIVTIPFKFEMAPKIRKALHGLEMLRKEVDAILIIQNDKLNVADNEEDTSMKESFKYADNVLKDAAKSISELITHHTDGDINLDFCDVETTLRNGGKAVMAVGIANGEHRLKKAIVNALNSPLLYGNDISDANRLLFSIYTSEELPLGIHEMVDIETIMHKVNPNIDVIWGTSTDDTLGDNLKIIIVAAGFKSNESTEQTEPKNQEIETLMEELYHFKTSPSSSTMPATNMKCTYSQDNSIPHDFPLNIKRDFSSEQTKSSFISRAVNYLMNMVEENNECAYS